VDGGGARSPGAADPAGRAIPRPPLTMLAPIVAPSPKEPTETEPPRRSVVARHGPPEVRPLPPPETTRVPRRTDRTARTSHDRGGSGAETPRVRSAPRAHTTRPAPTHPRPRPHHRPTSPRTRRAGHWDLRNGGRPQNLYHCPPRCEPSKAADLTQPHSRESPSRAHAVPHHAHPRP